MGRRLRRPRAEQPLLTPIRVDVGHAIAAVSEHHRHVPQHPPRIVRRAPLPRPGQRSVKALRSARPGQPTRPATPRPRARPAPHRPPSLLPFRHEPLASPTGCPPGSRSRLQESRILTAREDVPATRRQPTIGASRLAVAVLASGPSAANDSGLRAADLSTQTVAGWRPSTVAQAPPSRTSGFRSPSRRMMFCGRERRRLSRFISPTLATKRLAPTTAA